MVTPAGVKRFGSQWSKKKDKIVNFSSRIFAILMPFSGCLETV